jgi:hypothetical protein
LASANKFERTNYTITLESQWFHLRLKLYIK